MDEFVIKTVLKGPSKLIQNSDLAVNIENIQKACFSSTMASCFVLRAMLLQVDHVQYKNLLWTLGRIQDSVKGGSSRGS